MEFIHMNKLNNYLDALVPKRPSWMLELEQYARENRVPIMETSSMNFLTQLVSLHQPKRILEIGTAIGYSALRMAHAHPDAEIVSIEKNSNMYQLALDNINRFHHEDKINVMLGDALELLDELALESKSFDFVFIDAAKSAYEQYFTLVEPLVPRNGVIVCDNVLFKGYVLNPPSAPHKRHETIAKKLQSFNRFLMERPNFHSSIVPIGDGVSISIKK